MTPQRRPIIPFGIKLLFLFIAVPLLEIVTVYWLFQLTGFAMTVLIIILSAVVGVTLMKREWRYVFGKYRRDGLKGQHPGEVIAEGILLLLAGALLISPGIFTDIVGYSILVPPVRKLYMVGLRKHFQGKFQAFAQSGGAGGAKGFHFQFGTGFPPPGAGPQPQPTATADHDDEEKEESIEGSKRRVEGNPFEDHSPFGKKRQE